MRALTKTSTSLHCPVLLLLAICVAIGCSGQSSNKSSTLPATAAARPSQAKSADTVDLLKQIELPRDQVRGEFRLSEGALLIPAVAAAQLELPVEPPLSYRLEMEVERIAGNGSLNIGLVVDGHPTMLVLEGWGRTVSGLSLVDDRTAESNSTTYRQPIFVDGQPIEIKCTVHPQQVKVQCGDHTVVEWQGDPARLSLDEPSTRVRTPNRLLIGGWQSEFRITRLQLTSLGGDVIIAALPNFSDADDKLVAPLGEDWPVFEAKGHGFSVKMPRTPSAKREEGVTQFIAETSDGAYLVAVNSVHDRGGLSPNDFLNQWQSETFNSGEKVLRVRPLTMAGADAAREVAVVDSENSLLVGRYFLTRDRFYQVLYVGKPDRLGAAETKWFLASFRFAGP